MNAELLRLVDSIARDKNIDREVVVSDLEAAMVSAVQKAYGPSDDVQVMIDRKTGDITAYHNGQPIAMSELGRIAAQSAKQIIIQRIREAERGSIFEEFSQKIGEVVTGTVTRIESGSLIVNLGRAEAILPRSEQIPGETHKPGDRLRALIIDVREAPGQVRIVLSRASEQFVRRLFELEVPEVAERVVEIKALAREAGYRTKVAVASIDSKVDAVGACVGVRGSRIKNIVEELGGEKIDIVRWNESSQILIANALRPAEINEMALCFELGRCTVVVNEDQLSLAIGKKGQNVRLAARLTGWDIDILTPAEYNRNLDEMERVLREVPGVEDVVFDKLVALGVISLMDIDEIGPEPLVKELELEPGLAEQIVVRAREYCEQKLAEQQEAQAREAEAAAAGEGPTSAEPPAETPEDQVAPPAAEVAPTVAGEADPQPEAAETEVAERAPGAVEAESPTPHADKPEVSPAADAGGTDAGAHAVPSAPVGAAAEGAPAAPDADESPAVAPERSVAGSGEDPSPSGDEGSASGSGGSEPSAEAGVPGVPTAPAGHVPASGRSGETPG